MNHAADEFLQLVLRECEISDGGLGAWLLSIPLNEGSADWISARPNGRVVPAQGWKLHVSATVVDANETLRRALPLLVAERAAFKIVASPRRLHELNQGRAGLSQIGKFLTVYPIDPSEAVKMATALDRATRGLEGPVIPSDRPLRTGSAVHYRYGGFRSRVMQTLIGELVPAMTGVGGEVVPDLRAERYVPPEEIPDPFVVAGVATELRRPSQVLGGRFVVARSLSESARGSVELALDVQDLRRVVLKRAGRAAQAAANGRDASDRLRYEASVLASVAFEIGFPEPYELFVDGDGLVLAMEDIAGPSLLEYVSQFAGECELPPVKEVLRWAQLLAASIGKLHAQGWVHRDLKPTNVVLADDGRLRLLDAEGTVQLGTIESAGLVTLGYCSPQQAGGAAADVADDVYAFGALLRFALTGSDSSSYLGGSAPVRMSVRWWNPRVSPMVAAVVERCLDPKPRNQFGSMDELQHALADIRAEADEPPLPYGSPVSAWSEILGGAGCSDGLALRAEHARNLARRLGDAIVGLSRPSDPRPARIWLTDAVSGLDIPVRDLGLGVGGVVLVLAELVDAFNEPAHRSVLRDGANWLRQAPAPEGPGAAGLYAGEAGVGTALLRAGQVLADPRLIDAAEAYSRSLAKRSHICPDLYSGSAGRLRFHLMLWDETGADEHLSFAVEAGKALLSARRSFGPGVAWPMPDGCGSLSRHAWLGYAHGAAGIADSFLDLADATDERRWLEPASDTLVLLRRLARPALGDMDGLQWPSVLDVAQSRGGASWCHGAAGIGRFLLHASRVGLDADAIEQTRRAGRTVARGARWAVPVQCHGLAGAIEFLLDLARYTGEAAHLEEAWVLSQLLETFLVERNGLLLAASDSPERVTPDYSTGVAGVAACFLRLADRHRSHLLSRSAFNHRSNSGGA